MLALRIEFILVRDHWLVGQSNRSFSTNRPCLLVVHFRLYFEIDRRDAPKEKNTASVAMVASIPELIVSEEVRTVKCCVIFSGSCRIQPE